MKKNNGKTVVSFEHAKILMEEYFTPPGQQGNFLMHFSTIVHDMPRLTKSQVRSALKELIDEGKVLKDWSEDGLMYTASKKPHVPEDTLGNTYGPIGEPFGQHFVSDCCVCGIAHPETRLFGMPGYDRTCVPCYVKANPELACFACHEKLDSETVTSDSNGLLYCEACHKECKE